MSKEEIFYDFCCKICFSGIIIKFIWCQYHIFCMHIYVFTTLLYVCVVLIHKFCYFTALPDRIDLLNATGTGVAQRIKQMSKKCSSRKVGN